MNSHNEYEAIDQKDVRELADEALEGVVGGCAEHRGNDWRHLHDHDHDRGWNWRHLHGHDWGWNWRRRR